MESYPILMDKITQYCEDVSFSQLDLFNAILIKISKLFFVDINKLILKLILEDERHRKANIVLKEKNRVIELMLSKSKNSYKATIIKTVSYC
jgi:hypothetical protein